MEKCCILIVWWIHKSKGDKIDKINKIGKPLAKLIKGKKRELKIRNEKDVIAYTTEIQRLL